MKRPASALALAVAFTVAGPSVTATGASADSSSPHVSIDTGHGWNDTSVPLFDLSQIQPGYEGTATLRVRNDSDAPTSVSLSAVAVVDDENGCSRDEALVDHTCSGFDTGELSHELDASVSTDAGEVTTTLDALEKGAALGELGPGAVGSYQVDVALPRAAGNETQSDRLGFTLRVTLADLGSVDVLGTKISRGGPSGVSALIRRLPFTGTPAERLVAAGLLLLLLGTFLRLAAMQRDGRRTRPLGGLRTAPID